MKFNDFDLSLTNDVYAVNIHDDADNDEVIVVDFIYVNDTENFNQMLLSTKDMLESVLAIFFYFDDNKINEVLAEISED